MAWEGGALTYAIIQLAWRDAMPAFITSNDAAPRARDLWLRIIVVAIVSTFAAGAAVCVRSRWRERIPAVARALCPILVLCLLPDLFDYRAWVGRDLSFLLAATGMCLSLPPLLTVSGAALAEIGLAGYLGELRLLRTFRREPKIAFAIVLLSTLGVALYFGIYTVRVHHKLQTSILDLGLFDNLFWNALHGRPFYAPSANGRSLSYLGIHAEFLLYPLLPIYALAPCAETLLWIQAILVASSAIPIYLIARRCLGHLEGALLAVGLLLYPPLQQPVFYDFHFLSLATALVLWAAFCLDRRKWAAFWLFAVLCMMCREDVALGVFCVAIGLALSTYRPRTGIVLALISTTYFLLIKFVVMKHFGGESFVWYYKGLLPKGEQSFSGVLTTLLVNPFFTLESLFVVDKLVYVLEIFMPVAFLAVLRPRQWILLAPGALITLLTTGYSPVVQTRFQYVTHFVPYVFLAVVMYLVEIRKDRQATAVALITFSIAMLIAAGHFGAFQQNNFVSGFKRIDFHWSEADAARLKRLQDIATRIPLGASLCASEPEGAHLGNRAELFALKDRIDGAEYILYSVRDLGFGRDRELLRSVLTHGDYGLFAENEEFVVLRQGAETKQNARLLGKV